MIMTGRSGNELLDLLPAAELGRLLDSSQTASMSLGEIVFQQDGPVPYAYFPTTSVCGVVVDSEEGRQVEGTTVGREGMVGLPMFLGVDFHPFRVIVEVPGEAVRIAAGPFWKIAEPGSSLDLLMRRYTLYRLRSATQTGACSTVHAVEERMARWLLMNHDRAGKEEFPITHEFMSELLGVRHQTGCRRMRSAQRADCDIACTSCQTL
jgi:CRP-like cAMP-binding protein